MDVAESSDEGEDEDDGGVLLDEDDDDDDGDDEDDPATDDASTGSAESGPTGDEAKLAVLVLVAATQSALVAARPGDEPLPVLATGDQQRSAVIPLGEARCGVILGRTAHCYLGGELSPAATGATRITQVVVAPFFDPPVLAPGADLRWTPVAKLQGRWAKACAALALVRTRSFRSSPHLRRVDLVGGDIGKRLTAMLPRTQQHMVPVPEATKERIRSAQLAEQRFRDLLRERSAQDPTLESWVDRVGAVAPEDFPETMIGDPTHRLQDIIDTEPFPPLPLRPATVPPPRPRQPRTSWRPRGIRDILKPEAIKKIIEWLRDQAADLRRLARIGPTARRRFRRSLVISQEEVWPQARGVAWDLRVRDADGTFPPLDFEAKLDTHLNLEFIAELAQTSPDKALFDALLHGITFRAEVPLDGVFMPHLTSLSAGLTKVDKEFDRLAAQGWYEKFIVDLSDETEASGDLKIPFWPIRLYPNGSTARKLEPDRPRRTSDGSAPRKPLANDQGQPVVSMNQASNIQGSEEVTLQDGTTQLQRRFPREIKPTLRQIMQINGILYAASVFLRRPLLGFTDDSKSYFNQFKTARWEYWKMCVCWAILTELEDQGIDRQRAVIVAEYCMGFGFSPNSNYGQRVGNELVTAVVRIFDEEEARINAAEAQTDPLLAEWLRRREELGRKSGKFERRLFGCVQFTDDPCYTAVGEDRTIRLIQVHQRVMTKLQIIMAIAEKRDAGAAVKWLGWNHHLMAGAVAALPYKTLAVKDVVQRLLADGDSPQLDVTATELRSLQGLLEHMEVLAQGRRIQRLKGIGRPRRGLGPTDKIWRRSITPNLREKLRFWEDVASRAGAVAFNVAFDQTAPVQTTTAKVRFVIYTDAAKDGTEHPALGGYLDGGLFFALPLRRADVVGPEEIPIPCLEFATWAVAAMVFGRYVRGHPVALLSDSLTSTDAIQNDSVAADLMLFIAEYLYGLDAFKKLCDDGLVIGHVYGDGNPLGDAPSRGNFTLLKELCAQIGIPCRRLEVPPEAYAFMEAIREKLRAFRDEMGDS